MGDEIKRFQSDIFQKLLVFFHKLTVICIIVCTYIQQICYNSNLIVKFIFGLSSGHLKLKSFVIEV